MSAALDTMPKRLWYSVSRIPFAMWWLIRWPCYAATCVFLLLAAWPWWVITGVNLFQTEQPPFKWMQQLHNLR